MVIWGFSSVGFSPRRVHPALEALAVVLMAVVGWYLLQAPIARLLPAGIATNVHSEETVIAGAVASVSPRSTIEVHGNDRAPKVFVVRGQVTFDVMPAPDQRPFEAYSGDLAVTATDARFTMVCWDNHSEVQVVRGVVYVEANGRTIRLAAGAQWPKSSSESAVRASGGAGDRRESPVTY